MPIAGLIFDGVAGDRLHGVFPNVLSKFTIPLGGIHVRVNSSASVERVCSGFLLTSMRFSVFGVALEDLI